MAPAGLSAALGRVSLGLTSTCFSVGGTEPSALWMYAAHEEEDSSASGESGISVCAQEGGERAGRAERSSTASVAGRSDAARGAGRTPDGRGATDKAECGQKRAPAGTAAARRRSASRWAAGAPASSRHRHRGWQTHPAGRASRRARSGTSRRVSPGAAGPPRAAGPGAAAGT